METAGLAETSLYTYQAIYGTKRDGRFDI